MPPAQLQWINIEDFTPGIRHKVMGLTGSGSKQPPGAADAAGTWRCIALPSGGLGPLPIMDYSMNALAMDSIARVQDSVFRICGLHVSGPILTTGAAGIDNCEVHMGIEYLYDTDLNGTYDQRRFRWTRHRMWEAVPTRDTIHTVDSTQPTPASNYRKSSFTDCRMHPTDPAQVGYPLVACAWYAGGGGDEKVWKVFPDPNAPTVTGTLDISTTIAVDNLAQHQGRLVGLNQVAHPHGSGAATWSSNEQVWWTNVNIPTLSNLIASMLSQGLMAGFGVVMSVSAQELLLVKHQYGAVAVGGDMDNPTITQMPGVMAEGQANTVPTYSPAGLIYGVRGGGVYAWQGGIKSDNIAPFMDDDFWRMPTETYGFIQNEGKFDTWGQWVMAPNNWLYDTELQSWWRIENPATEQIMYWARSPDGKLMYGSPIYYSGTGNPAPTVLYRWNRATPAKTYRWRSQYFAPPQDRVNDVREITIEASGPALSTVTITLSDETGATQAETFTIDSVDIPKTYRKSTRFQSTAFKVQIDATGGAAGTLSAPTVFGVGIGYVEDQRVANG